MTISDSTRTALHRETGLPVETNVQLAPYTTLKIGGPADFFIRAPDGVSLGHILTASVNLGLQVLVLGGGSNVVISDRGFRGLGIKVETRTSLRNRGTIVDEDGPGVVIQVEPGCQTAGIARWTAQAGWSGLDWACGIPGTIGGAIAGNAGAYDGDMKAVVNAVTYWSPAPTGIGSRSSHICTVSGNEMAFGYRTSRLKTPGSGVVLGAELRLGRATPTELQERIDRFETSRRARQPTERSCGSVFRNPPGMFAGQLVEQSGLKGHRFGDAQISLLHGNYIVNRGTATSHDIYSLIVAVRDRILRDTGIALETEVILAGDWPADEHAVGSDSANPMAEALHREANSRAEVTTTGVGERNG
ncbi:MAG: UDP-N-acetylmuramate dehydrogenase [Chloroflexi bacterium]|nr:UDP-N-acetylmuramate dehydrogenase [Chloroflexota bacterium]